MIIDGVAIADIHIGAVPAKVLRVQLWKVFFPKLLRMKKIDLITIPGDLFDHKLSFNGEDAKLAIEFMQTLLKIAKQKGAKVRILKGTKNHDLNQLNNFLHLEKNPNYDFKVVNTVTSEEIFPKVKVLYLPEEYMEDMDEYYADHFSKKYDMAFFHGTFSHVGFVNKSQESERPMHNAPIFEYEKMKKFIKGPIIGGHIHNAEDYKNKVFYTHSFTRWHYGEEDDKGFRIFKYDSDTGKYKVGFVKNDLAPTYVTLDINEIFNDKKKTVDQKIALIESIKNDKNIDNLRVKFDRTTIEQESDVNLIKEYFANQSNESVKVSVNNIQKSQEQEEENKLEEEYSFIFKKEFPMPKIISEYLRKHDNILISDDIVSSILFSNNDDKEESG
jgi:hypothetical protein